MTRPHVTVVGDVGLDIVAKLAGDVVFGQDTRAAVTVAPGTRTRALVPGGTVTWRVIVEPERVQALRVRP